jgi:hypothetical protein
MSADEPEPTLSTDAMPDVLRDLARVLGIGIIVREIDEGATVTIRAVVLLGQHSEEIVGEGASEAAAWRDLARSAIAWRTTNDKQVPWWGGGG